MIFDAAEDARQAILEFYPNASITDFTRQPSIEQGHFYAEKRLALEKEYAECKDDRVCTLIDSRIVFLKARIANPALRFRDGAFFKKMHYCKEDVRQRVESLICRIEGISLIELYEADPTLYLHKKSDKIKRLRGAARQKAKREAAEIDFQKAEEEADDIRVAGFNALKSVDPDYEPSTYPVGNYKEGEVFTQKAWSALKGRLNTLEYNKYNDDPYEEPDIDKIRQFNKKNKVCTFSYLGLTKGDDWDSMILRDIIDNDRYGRSEYEYFKTCIFDTKQSSKNVWKTDKSSHLNALNNIANHFETSIKQVYGGGQGYNLSKINPADFLKRAQQNEEEAGVARYLPHLRLKTWEDDHHVDICLSTCIKKGDDGELYVYIPKADVALLAQTKSCHLICFAHNESLLFVNTYQLSRMLKRMVGMPRSSPEYACKALQCLLGSTEDHWSVTIPVSALFREGLINEYLLYSPVYRNKRLISSSILSSTKKMQKIVIPSSAEYQKFNMYRRNNGNAKVVMISLDHKEANGLNKSRQFPSKVAAYNFYCEMSRRISYEETTETLSGFAKNIRAQTKYARTCTLSQRPIIYTVGEMRVIFLSITEELSPAQIHAYTTALQDTCIIPKPRRKGAFSACQGNDAIKLLKSTRTNYTDKER